MQTACIKRVARGPRRMAQDANSKFRKFYEFYLSAPVAYMSKQKYAHGVKNELK